MNKQIAISIISALGLTFAASSFANEDDDYTVTAADVREICQEESQGDPNPAEALKLCMEEYGFGDNKAEAEVQTAAADEAPVYDEPAEPAESYEDEVVDDEDTEESF